MLIIKMKSWDVRSRSNLVQVSSERVTQLRYQFYSSFPPGGAGALPIYWDKDWSYPYSCKLVNYQTAHSALVDGEYIDCVEENFKVNIR